MCQNPNWKEDRFRIPLETAADRAAWRALRIPFVVTANPAAYYG